MLKQRHIDRVVPTTTVVSFIVGVCLAVGHHCYYAWLDGSPVDGHNATFGQQFNHGVGITFAFLIRASLRIAAGTAYWQIFWRILSQRSLSVSTIDSVFGALTSLFDLLDLKALRSTPTLALLALIAWLLPIPALLTPGTLAVVNRAVVTHTDL